jgi:hypothetical protein
LESKVVKRINLAQWDKGNAAGIRKGLLERSEQAEKVRIRRIQILVF